MRSLPLTFAVHLRSAKTLQMLPGVPPGLLVDPQPYLEFNGLVKHARAVITDSGPIAEEPTVMGVPCLTLRDTIERPKTIVLGANEPIGTDPVRMKPALVRPFAGQWKKGSIPENCDGKSGERIVAALERLLAT
jgi:UDP-N-acetylglucosamine 2-epimerase (non-hydrolysing)